MDAGHCCFILFPWFAGRCSVPRRLGFNEVGGNVFRKAYGWSTGYCLTNIVEIAMKRERKRKEKAKERRSKRTSWARLQVPACDVLTAPHRRLGFHGALDKGVLTKRAVVSTRSYFLWKYHGKQRLNIWITIGHIGIRHVWTKRDT